VLSLDLLAFSEGRKTAVLFTAEALLGERHLFNSLLPCEILSGYLV
jgi:hypothetical protein